jgi:hypothetical protein
MANHAGIEVREDTVAGGHNATLVGGAQGDPVDDLKMPQWWNRRFTVAQETLAEAPQMSEARPKQ